MREKQRAELHKTIWAIANELRGSVDGWDFKAYVLITLFYRFISEDITSYINVNANEPQGFDYATFDDQKAQIVKEKLVKAKGYFILPSQLFGSLINKIKNDNIFAQEHLNEELKAIFESIESSTIGTDSERNFKSLFNDFKFNDKALGHSVIEQNNKLKKVLFAIDALDFGDITESSIDLFGDAYEYLMRMYASNAGKSGGEYFTPQEVSRLLSELASFGQKEVNKVYDPACGSGSLLLQVAKVLGKENIIKGFFGQEINLTSYNLCRMNMLLHHIDFNQVFIAHGDTLLNPDVSHKEEEPFDIIVSNPPYSTKWEGKDNAVLMRDVRFTPAGVLAPKSKSDLAFVMHILSWLSPKGAAAIVEFPGVLYRGGDEAIIREYLVRENYIDCIIQLPENLFYGVTIATCIIVLKKNKREAKTLFINASEFFVKVTNKNKLSDENIAQILALYKKRENVPHLSALVDNRDILANEANLSVSSYVEAKDTREVVDIKALNAEILEIVAQQNALRQKIDQIVAALETA